MGLSSKTQTLDALNTVKISTIHLGLLLGDANIATETGHSFLSFSFGYVDVD